MKRLTKREVKDVILQFWELNASRAPIKAFEGIFDCEKLEIIVRADPDIVFNGIAGFADHQIGKLSFFDQRFELKSIDTKLLDDSRAVAKTVGVWNASYWQSPAPTSHRLIADMKQTWTIVRSEETGKAVLLRHVCERLKYRPGHAPIAAPQDFHMRIGGSGK
jgi:hypothetical protein